MRRYLFALAVLMSVGLTKPGQCQGLSSAGNPVSAGQLTFRPVDTSHPAAPISTVGFKNSQGSKFGNMMAKFPMPGFLRSNKTPAAPAPAGKVPGAKQQSDVAPQMLNANK